MISVCMDLLVLMADSIKSILNEYTVRAEMKITSVQPLKNYGNLLKMVK